MGNHEQKLGIITTPFLLEAGIPPCLNLFGILSSISSEVYMITGGVRFNLPNPDRLRYVNTNSNIKHWNLKYIYSLIKIQYYMIKLRKDVDVWFIFIGELPLLVPILTGRLLNKKIIFITSSSLEDAKHLAPNIPTKIFLNICSIIDLYLATKIIAYSEDLIGRKDLMKYREKILFASEHFLDFEIFKPKKSLRERTIIIGYVGRLNKEKGIMNFIEAIPLILKKIEVDKFFICGEGRLKKDAERYIAEYDLIEKVKFMGWVPHLELADYLNDMKLIVIPSYTEGLPNIMLEAMACGTPVLAMPVGRIPDLIEDGKTGFLLKDNTPQCIAEKVQASIENVDITKITQNAVDLVKRDFSFKIVREKWIGILDVL